MRITPKIIVAIVVTIAGCVAVSDSYEAMQHFAAGHPLSPLGLSLLTATPAAIVTAFTTDVFKFGLRWLSALAALVAGIAGLYVGAVLTGALPLPLILAVLLNVLVGAGYAWALVTYGTRRDWK